MKVRAEERDTVFGDDGHSGDEEEEVRREEIENKQTSKNKK